MIGGGEIRDTTKIIMNNENMMMVKILITMVHDDGCNHDNSIDIDHNNDYWC